MPFFFIMLLLCFNHYKSVECPHSLYKHFSSRDQCKSQKTQSPKQAEQENRPLGLKKKCLKASQSLVPKIHKAQYMRLTRPSARDSQDLIVKIHKAQCPRFIRPSAFSRWQPVGKFFISIPRALFLNTFPCFWCLSVVTPLDTVGAWNLRTWPMCKTTST